MAGSSRLLAGMKRDALQIYAAALEAVRPDRLVQQQVRFVEGQPAEQQHEEGVQEEKEKEEAEAEEREEVSRSSVEVQGQLKLQSPAKQLPSVTRQLHLAGARLELTARVSLHVLGAGKSALAMADGLAKQVSEASAAGLFSHGCLSVPGRTSLGPQASEERLERLRSQLAVRACFGAAENLADESSVRAAAELLASARLACREDLAAGKQPVFIVLLSGGGSSCLASPRLISLEQKRELTGYLVERGANIVELNQARSYFSQLKAGGLARAICEAHPEAVVHSLIVSDVAGDPVEYIASGPTCVLLGPQERLEAARRVLWNYQWPGAERLLGAASVGLGEPVGLECAARVRNTVIGNNGLALEGARREARRLGWQVVDLLAEGGGQQLEGPSEDIARRLVEAGAARPHCNRLLVLGAGEATVRRLPGDGWGPGGRCQEMALDYMLLAPGEPQARADLLLAGSTDGQDGPTAAGACLATWSGWPGAPREELGAAKRAHSSHAFWSRRRPSWLLAGGLTGANVMDVYLLLLLASSSGGGGGGGSSSGSSGSI